MRRSVIAFALVLFIVSLPCAVLAADSYTPRLNLTKPSRGSANWDTKFNANSDKVDSAYGDIWSYMSDAPEVYYLTGTFNGTTGASVALPKSVNAITEYGVAVVPSTRAGAIGDIYVEQGLSTFTVRCSEANTTDTFKATVYYKGTLNAQGVSQFRKWYVSTDAAITDHGNAAQVGSLAWVLAQVGANIVDIELPGNHTYVISTNVTIPGNVHPIFQHGAQFACDSGKSVSFAAGSVKEVYPEWWGAKGDGVTDDTAALQAAVDSISTGWGTVKVGSCIYAMATAVQARMGVTIEGTDNKTIFKLIGNANGFEQYEDFWSALFAGSSSGYWTPFRNFVIDASENSNNIDLIYLNRHWNQTVIEGITFVGNSSAAQRGFHWYHTDPTSRANFGYHNTIRNCTFIDLKATDGALYLQGTSTGSRRANNNLITENKFTGYKLGVHIGGIGNYLIKNLFNAPDNPVKMDNSGGTGLRFRIYDGYSNVIASNWFEGGASDVLGMMAGQGTASNSAPADFTVSNVALDDPLQVADLAVPVATSYGNIAAYSDTNTLVVAGINVTTTYPIGRRVWIDCGVDGWRTSTVSSVSFSTDTTIDLTDTILTANLATISPTHATAISGLRSYLQAGSALYLSRGRFARLHMGDSENYVSNMACGTATVVHGTTSTVVSNTSVKTGSKVFLQASGIIAAGLTGVYVLTSEHVPGTSFAIHHSDPGGSNNGIFFYWIVN